MDLGEALERLGFVLREERTVGGGEARVYAAERAPALLSDLRFDRPGQPPPPGAPSGRVRIRRC